MSKLIFFALYIKTNTVFGLSKYYCINIDKNMLKINSSFFYENQKFRPQRGTLCIYFRFFRGCQRNFFSLYIKRNSVLVSLKILIEINSLFFYENPKFRPFVYISDFFEDVKVKFFRFMYV